MPITVIVHSMTGDESPLTFDGTQRVVIGRGGGSDVRVPDLSVSHRHASLRSQGAEFVVVDEGSTNGTYVGEVRVAPHTSRLVRSGDWVRVGRIWLRIIVDQSPATRDLAMATRELALAFVARAMKEQGIERTSAIRVVEGDDQGIVLLLAEEGREYVIGRGAQCALALADADVSREHVLVVRKNGAVMITDLGAKNGTWLAGTRILGDQPVAWRSAQMVKVGRTVMALIEPVAETLCTIEEAQDEVLDQVEASATRLQPSDSAIGPAVSMHETSSAASANAVTSPKRLSHGRHGWSLLDLVVISAALSILLLSLVGIFWLLRGVSPTWGR